METTTNMSEIGESVAGNETINTDEDTLEISKREKLHYLPNIGTILKTIEMEEKIIDN